LRLPCPSDAQILAFCRGGALDIEGESQFLREQTSAYLVDGMLLAGLERRAGAAGV
jgi:hypothetical protein